MVDCLEQQRQYIVVLFLHGSILGTIPSVGILAAAQGARTVIIRDIDPGLILKLIPEQQIVHAFWVPAVILMLTQQPTVRDTDFSSLKQVFYGASPIAEDLLKEAAEIMGARVVDVTPQSFIFELAETSEQVDAFIELMRPLGLVEVARTGVAALLRGNEALE